MSRLLKFARVGFIVGVLGAAVAVTSAAQAGGLRGESGHRASGSAKITGSSIKLGSNFQFDGGPDVYVAVSGPGQKLMLLGKLRKNSGFQAYRLPSGVKNHDVNRVVLWCKRYGVALGSASVK